MTDGRKVHVLAVDDEVLNNELLERTFRAHPDYQLHVVTSASEGLRYLADGNKVDIMLVDQSMPQMSGTEFVREAVRHGVRAQVIMVTAFPELLDVVKSWEEGLVRGILPKPWRPADLVQTVERFARNVRA